MICLFSLSCRCVRARRFFVVCEEAGVVALITIHTTFKCAVAKLLSAETWPSAIYWHVNGHLILYNCVPFVIEKRI